MAKIITCFNQKGGCGKTMVSMQLGGTLATMGLKVFIVDMDPQNTAALWFHEADEQPFPADVMSMAPLKEHFVDKLQAIIKKYDVVIVDCPPALESQVPWVSLLSSDLAIIPVIPVLDNIWASRQAEELATAAQKHNPALRTTYLLNMVRRGRIFDMCRAKLEKMAQSPILNSKISMRNAYVECQAYGCVVSAFGASTATDEARRLSREVAGLLGLGLTKGN